LCALNPAYHISKVVSLAGFDSVYSLARSHYPAIRFGRWLALEVQWLNYGKAGLVSGLKLMILIRAKRNSDKAGGFTLR
jgi:hypothetical protein